MYTLHVNTGAAAKRHVIEYHLQDQYTATAPLARTILFPRIESEYFSGGVDWLRRLLRWATSIMRPAPPPRPGISMASSGAAPMKRARR